MMCNPISNVLKLFLHRGTFFPLFATFDHICDSTAQSKGYVFLCLHMLNVDRFKILMPWCCLFRFVVKIVHQKKISMLIFYFCVAGQMLGIDNINKTTDSFTFKLVYPVSFASSYLNSRLLK